MTSTSLDISRLRNSVAFSILSEGDHSPDCVDRLVQLNTSDPKTFSKLFGICRRLDFIEHVRYAKPISVSDTSRQAFLYNINRLAAYLASTCIEIAVSPDEQSYAEWLKGAVDSGVIDMNNYPEVKAIKEGKSPEVLQTSIVSFIISTHENEYRDSIGLTRAFRKFFNEKYMYEWLQQWIANTYYIVKGEFFSEKAFKDLADKTWVKKDYKDRCREIADYLYGQVRNKHTHTANYYPHQERGGSIGITGMDYEFINFPKEDRRKPFSIGMKTGFVESQVIRFLVVCHIRKNWLDIKDSAEFIDNYWTRANHQRKLFSFLDEIRTNISKLQVWCSGHLYAQTLQYMHFAPMYTLDDSAAREIMLAKSGDSFLATPYDIQTYLYLIEKINSRISRYQKRYPDKAKHYLSSRSFFERLTKSGEIHQLFRMLQDYQQVTVQKTNQYSTGLVSPW